MSEYQAPTHGRPPCLQFINALPSPSHISAAVTNTVSGLTDALEPGFDTSIVRKYFCMLHHTETGCLQLIADAQGKQEALDALVDHLIPGRSADNLRPTTKAEFVSTMMVSMPLTEASAKVRTGFSIYEEGDLEQDVWVGQIPLQQVVGRPIKDPLLKDGIATPDYVLNYTRQLSQ